jgi:hypothetical protein
MSMDIITFKCLAQVVAGLEKAGSSNAGAREKLGQFVAGQRPPIHRGRNPVADLITGGNPDYGRSLVSQSKRDPHTAGLVRGAAGGTAGAVLLALLARMVTENPKYVGGAAAAGGLLGGGAGYISGKGEAESNHTKSLALRRLGINNPAELLVTRITPSLTQRIVGRGGMSEVL